MAIKIPDLINELVGYMREGYGEIEFRCIVGPDKLEVDDEGYADFRASHTSGTGDNGDGPITVVLLAN